MPLESFPFPVCNNVYLEKRFYFVELCVHACKETDYFSLLKLKARAVFRGGLRVQTPPPKFWKKIFNPYISFRREGFDGRMRVMIEDDRVDLTVWISRRVRRYEGLICAKNFIG